MGEVDKLSTTHWKVLFDDDTHCPCCRLFPLPSDPCCRQIIAPTTSVSYPCSPQNIASLRTAQSAEGGMKRTMMRRWWQQIGQQRLCNDVTINLPAKDKRCQLTIGGWKEVEAMRGLADDGKWMRWEEEALLHYWVYLGTYIGTYLPTSKVLPLLMTGSPTTRDWFSHYSWHKSSCVESVPMTADIRFRT